MSGDRLGVVDTAPLLVPIQRELVALLRGLTPEQAAREVDIGNYGTWKDAERLVLNLMRLWLELDGRRPSERIDAMSAFGAMAELAAERG